MKFTEKVKRFFTLSAKHEGFTLVELIVVIAILAILAGVAVPAYSGYIKKANRAGDMTLLSAVNKAFASACVTAGSDISLVTEAGLDATVGSPIKGITGVKATGTIDADAVKSGFQMLFVDENPDASFEVIQPVFVAGIGFVAKDEVPAGATYSVGYGNGVLTMKSDSVNALVNSNLGAMGAEILLTETSEVVNWAAQNGLLDSAGSSFYSAYAGYLGVDLSKYDLNDPEQAEAAQDAINAALVKIAGNDTAAQDKVAANAIALYAAQNSSGITSDSLLNKWLGGKGSVDSMQSQANASTLSEAAAIYGLYMSYKGEDFDSSNGALDVMTEAMTDEKFAEWVGGDTGKAELNAYLGAMDIISSSANDAGATSSVLANGFADEELIKLMEGVIG